MFKIKNKKTPLKDILAVFLCFGAVLGISVLVKANPSAKVQFTADTILSLSGISDGDLYIAQDSECDSLTVSGSTLTVDVPDASIFTLKTAAHRVLRLTPSGGTVTLTFDSGYLSSGYVSQWTASSSVTNAQVSFLVGVAQASADYLIKVDSSNLEYSQSNSAGEVSFTYSGGFSSKVFTITREDRPVTPAPSGGGGMPAEWFMPPKPPTGGFRILINDGTTYTDSEIVTLKLTGGSDTERMAISNFSDFRDAGQELYAQTKKWNLCEGLSSCPDGQYTVYAKFYAPWGTISEVVSDSIILKTAVKEEPEIKVPEVEEKPKAPTEIPPKEEISPPTETIPELEKKPEVITEEIGSSRKEIAPAEKGFINTVKNFFRWVGQLIVGFWQRIWPF